VTHSSHKKPNKNFPQQMIPQRQQSMMRLAAKAYSFSGPLPPPEALEKYNQVLPGAADRIISMAEQQAKHRQGLERAVIDSNIFVQKVGPFLGFVVAMTAIGGGVYLIMQNKEVSGLAAILGALVSLAGVFVYGKSKQRKELNEKAEDFVPPHEEGLVRKG
jgi:uncharacterized membrane protein